MKVKLRHLQTRKCKNLPPGNAHERNFNECTSGKQKIMSVERWKMQKK